MALKGFFTIESTKPKRNNLENLRYNQPGEPDCANCGLNKQGCKRPFIQPTGKGRRGILGIAEAPGATEDTMGQNLVGDAGTFLYNTLKPLGIDLYEDLLTINSVNCRPPGNRKPTDHEMMCCRPFLLKTIEEFKPKHIWLFGGSAVSTYLRDRFKNKSIGRWVDIPFPDPENGAWVTAQYHPSFVMRGKNDNLRAVNQKYLRKAVNRSLWAPYDFPDLQSQVTILSEYKRVVFHLNRILRTKPEITIDYETTGRKPYKIGHKIYCVSIDDGERSYVFPLQRPGYWKEEELREILRLYTAILEDPEILKTAQGRNYEDTWSTTIIGAKVKGWDWCTMGTAHLIDSRPKYSGLKFQGFIHFGIKGYEDEIKPFLESDKNEEFNSIQNAPAEKLHLYCGTDTVITRELKKVQKKYLADNPDLERARKFLMEGLWALSKVQNEGILADKSYFEDQNLRLTKRIDRLELKIYQSDEAERFRRFTGKNFNYKSNKDLQILFFKVLGLTPVKFTNEEENNESVDAEVINGIDSPIARDILQCKKFIKIRDTYLAQFFREITEEGRIHPIQNLHIATTHRSSQDHPNGQNIPVRDEESKRICRSGIVASLKGETEKIRIVEKDYGSQEVRIIACYSEDPVLISYINDPTTDMHRDEASGLFILPKDRVSKMIRFYSKNCWVFPEFYKSYYVNCAKDLWKNVIEPNLKTSDGEPIQEHLKSKGIYTKGSFEEHCKKVEGYFWDKYKGVKKWQDQVIKKYQTLGYVESFFGHRRTGYLSPNDIVNSPIQGTAFHCLLWTLKEAMKRIPEHGFKSRINNQIHDSLNSRVYVEEQTPYIQMIQQIAEVEIRKEFSWLIVPLILEIEMTPIGGSWYQKEEVTLNDKGQWCSYNKDKTVKHVYDENY